MQHFTLPTASSSSENSGDSSDNDTVTVTVGGNAKYDGSFELSEDESEIRMSQLEDDKRMTRSGYKNKTRTANKSSSAAVAATKETTATTTKAAASTKRKETKPRTTKKNLKS